MDMPHADILDASEQRVVLHWHNQKLHWWHVVIASGFIALVVLLSTENIFVLQSAIQSFKALFLSLLIFSLIKLWQSHFGKQRMPFSINSSRIRGIALAVDEANIYEADIAWNAIFAIEPAISYSLASAIIKVPLGNNVAIWPYNRFQSFLWVFEKNGQTHRLALPEIGHTKRKTLLEILANLAQTNDVRLMEPKVQTF